jgi:fructose-bisphosphate aldolase class I
LPSVSPVSPVKQQQLSKVKFGHGLFAALDQSGGSTPQALARYGIGDDEYSGDDAMFELMHQMRSRIIASPRFGGDRVLGVILFSDTMDRQIDGQGSVEYCWAVKDVVPFLKVDKGIEDEVDGVQLMKPIPGLDELLARAAQGGVFGTKARSLIKLAHPAGVEAIVDQQFAVGRQVLDSGLIPILEPEIDIHSPQKAEAESLLKDAILGELGQLGPGEGVLLKLTLPDVDNFYADLIEHPGVVRVLALSGGYHRDEAVARLARNHGVVASFSRALSEGLSIHQSDAEFDAALDGVFSEVLGAANL